MNQENRKLSNEDLHTAVDIYLFCKEKGYETEKPVFPKNLKIT